MSHAEIKLLISRQMDRDLTPAEQNRLHTHLTACAECRAKADDYRALSAFLNRPEGIILKNKNRILRLRPPLTQTFLFKAAALFILTIGLSSAITLLYKQANNKPYRRADIETYQNAANTYETFLAREPQGTEKKSAADALFEAIHTYGTYSIKAPGLYDSESAEKTPINWDALVDSI